jgi:MoaA/NifB/PqqE/SkfB family radical SAM enzyme
MKTLYDIEADWILNILCNFDCAYCVGHSRLEHPSVSKLAARDAVEFFDDTNLTWLIHLTGGEPSFYHEFIELCQGLTNKHFISVNTNLTSNFVFKFAQVVDPQKVAFVHCGLHILQREKRGLVKDFITKFLFLKDKGFNIFVSYVVCSPIVERLGSDFEFFKSEGVVLIPKSLRGSYGGKIYPESYTAAEREIFVRYSTEAESLLTDFDSSALGERPTIDLFADRDFLTGLSDYRGQHCRAGMSFVRIQTNGAITRCGRRRTLGNLFRHKLNLLTEPQRCDDKCCPYFCLKYLVPGTREHCSKEGMTCDSLTRS